MRLFRAQLIVVLFALLTAPGADATPQEPDYVTFSIMGPSAFGPKIVNGIVQPQSLWASTEKNAVAEIRKEFGEQLPGKTRYVGFSIWIPTLNLSPEELRSEVQNALGLAEQNRIPVFFHLDDEHMIWANPDFQSTDEMSEWSDFPKPGQSHGPVVPRYWLNWGDPAFVYPLPPVCFACQPLRTIVYRRFKQCVAEPIVQRLSVWRKQGLDYLFAGVATGNETKVPDFSRGYEGYNGPSGQAAGMDMTKFPPVKERMSKEEYVPAGYHSLSVMGYNRQAVESLAKSQHKTAERITQELLFKVAQDYAEFQAKTLNHAGLPKDRIYTHFTSTSYTASSFDEQMRAVQARPSLSGRAGSDNLPPPVRASVNQYSRPGFTVVSNGVDLNQLQFQLKEAGAPENGKAWAVVESYACKGQPGASQTQEDYENYLGGLQSHGAKVVNCYGWNIPDGPYAVKGSGVIPAVKTWMLGKRLPSTWSTSSALSQQKRIQAKIANLQQLAHDLVTGGHDPHAIEPILSSFQKEFEPLLKSEKFSEAELCIDRAFARLRKL